MATKTDRWRKLTQERSSVVTPPNENKHNLIQELASGGIISSEIVNDDKNKQSVTDKDKERDKEQDKRDAENKNIAKEGSKKDLQKVNTNNKDNLSTQSVNTNSVDGKGIQSVNTDNVETESKNSNKSEEVFAAKVTHGVSYAIQNKLTKEDTHNRANFQLHRTTLAKLDNFDKAMGGRVKSFFINDLLDNFFEELEQDDERWREILNRNL